MNFESNHQREDYITRSTHKVSIHLIDFLLPYNKRKMSPGEFRMDIKIWDLFREEIQQGNMSLFGYLIVVDTPVTTPGCECI